MDHRRVFRGHPSGPETRALQHSPLEGVQDVNTNGKSQLPAILKKDETGLLADWLTEQTAGVPEERMKAGELREQSKEFLRLLGEAAQNGNVTDGGLPEWQSVREMLAGVSRSRAMQGFTPSETATFVFSLKK